MAGRGFSPASVVTSGYYDAIASGQGDPGKGAGKSTAALKRQVVFADWDFSEVWTIGEGKTYPTLRGIAASAGNDAAPPIIVSAAVSAEHPGMIAVTFDEEINMPAASGFTVTVDGVDRTVYGGGCGQGDRFYYQNHQKRLMERRKRSRLIGS